MPAGRALGRGIGDVRVVDTGGCTDLYFVDTGMYDTDAYGAVYVLDAERPAIIETGIGRMAHPVAAVGVRGVLHHLDQRE